MKKKGLIILDIIISIVILLGICFNEKINTEKDNIIQSRFFSEYKDLNFDFVVTPDYQKVLAGSTLTIKVDLQNIKMEENRIK